ncbi:DUF3500 domain-containing protein [Ohtaekwangia kribbensis]|uniref:DUF3500 domain-containing protein n=1 Tax=Ohtaekwangia kribbensis TaxID=688913 RepID=A0ABW3KAG2_9BACT
MTKLLCACVFFYGVAVQAQSVDVTQRANDFLLTLSPALKSKVQYTWDNDERHNWHFVPKDRNGISLHDLSEKQRAAAFALLKASLSSQGYQKATGILALEKILQQVEGRDDNDSYRDPLNYYFTIFGTPSADKLWGWRLEGHHLSLNFSTAHGIIESSTPSFWGSNPAVVPSGNERGKKTLKDEMDLGFALINALNEQQLAKARFSETALHEIVSYNKQQAELLTPAGILYKDLTPEQQQLFMKLLNTYVKNYEFGFAEKLMEKIKKAGIDKLSFAWAGALKPGAGHYYRIQGPMLLIEYDNTQNNANHIHSVVRDLTNDFAGDILREHYQKEHN